MKLLPHGEVWTGKAATAAALLFLAAAVVWTLVQRFRAVERLLAALLSRKLSGVLEHLEHRHITFIPWQGVFAIRDINLKARTLDALDLPFCTESGFIRKIHCQLQWGGLNPCRFILSVDGVTLNLGTRHIPSYTSPQQLESSVRKHLYSKRKRHLNSIDAALWSKPVSHKADSPSKDARGIRVRRSIMLWVLQAIARVEVRLHQLHVLYTQVGEHGNATIALHVGQFSIAEDRSGLLDIPLSCRLLLSDLLQAKGITVVMTQAITQPASTALQPSPITVLKQWSVTAHVLCAVTDPASTEKAPSLLLMTRLQPNALLLTGAEGALRCNMQVIDSLHMYFKYRKHRRGRPQVSVSERPDLWWKHAGQCVLRERWRLLPTLYGKTASMGERMRLRHEYIPLYLQEKLHPWRQHFWRFSRKRVEELESQMCTSEIAICRWLAKLKHENRSKGALAFLVATKAASLGLTAGVRVNGSITIDPYTSSQEGLHELLRTVEDILQGGGTRTSRLPMAVAVSASFECPKVAVVVSPDDASWRVLAAAHRLQCMLRFQSNDGALAVEAGCLQLQVQEEFPGNQHSHPHGHMLCRLIDSPPPRLIAPMGLQFFSLHVNLPIAPARSLIHLRIAPIELWYSTRSLLRLRRFLRKVSQRRPWDIRSASLSTAVLETAASGAVATARAATARSLQARTPCVDISMGDLQLCLPCSEETYAVRTTKVMSRASSAAALGSPQLPSTPRGATNHAEGGFACVVIVSGFHFHSDDYEPTDSSTQHDFATQETTLSDARWMAIHGAGRLPRFERFCIKLSMQAFLGKEDTDSGSFTNGHKIYILEPSLFSIGVAYCAKPANVHVSKLLRVRLKATQVRLRVSAFIQFQLMLLHKTLSDMEEITNVPMDDPQSVIGRSHHEGYQSLQRSTSRSQSVVPEAQLVISVELQMPTFTVTVLEARAQEMSAPADGGSPGKRLIAASHRTKHTTLPLSPHTTILDAACEQRMLQLMTSNVNLLYSRYPFQLGEHAVDFAIGNVTLQDLLQLASRPGSKGSSYIFRTPITTAVRHVLISSLRAAFIAWRRCTRLRAMHQSGDQVCGRIRLTKDGPNDIIVQLSFVPIVVDVDSALAQLRLASETARHFANSKLFARNSSSSPSTPATPCSPTGSSAANRRSRLRVTLAGMRLHVVKEGRPFACLVVLDTDFRARVAAGVATDVMLEVMSMQLIDQLCASRTYRNVVTHYRASDTPARFLRIALVRDQANNQTHARIVCNGPHITLVMRFIRDLGHIVNELRACCMPSSRTHDVMRLSIPSRPPMLLHAVLTDAAINVPRHSWSSDYFTIHASFLCVMSPLGANYASAVRACTSACVPRIRYAKLLPVQPDFWAGFELSASSKSKIGVHFVAFWLEWTSRPEGELPGHRQVSKPSTLTAMISFNPSLRVRVTWPSMRMLFGEIQYSLLMGVVFENSGEPCSFASRESLRNAFVGLPQGRVLQGAEAKPLPISSSETASWEVVVECASSDVIIEGVPNNIGHKGFAHPVASVAMTQLQVTIAVLQPSQALHIKVAAAKIRICDCTLQGFSQTDLGIIECPRASSMPTGDHFILDYIIKANGTHMLEVKLLNPQLLWPYVTDLDLVWSICDAYTHYFFAPTCALGPLNMAPSAWFFCNVILQGTEAFVPVPRARSGSANLLSLLPHVHKQGVQLSWSYLRVGYFWGGDGESSLVVDANQLSAHVMQPAGYSEQTEFLEPISTKLELKRHMPKDAATYPGTTSTLRMGSPNCTLTVRLSYVHADVYSRTIDMFVTRLQSRLQKGLSTEDGNGRVFATPPPTFRPHTLSASVQLGSIAIALDDDRLDASIEVLHASLQAPRLDVKREQLAEDLPAQLLVNVRIGTTEENTSADKPVAGVAVFLLSSSYEIMEPLLEPWPVSLELRTTGASKLLSVHSAERLRINIIPHTLRSAGDVLAFWKKFRTASMNSDLQDRLPSQVFGKMQRLLRQVRGQRQKSAYRINNCSGLVLTYWAEAAEAAQRQTHTVDLDSEVPLAAQPVDKAVIAPDSQHSFLAKTICMQPQGWTPVEDIIVDRVGKYVHEIESPVVQRLVPVICDVTLNVRTKTLTIHSPLKLFNGTSRQLDFRLHLRSPIAGTSGVLFLETLAAGAELFLPLTAVADAMLYVQAQGYERADKDVVRLDETVLPDQQGVLVCPHPDPEERPFHCCLQVTKEEGIKANRLGPVNEYLMSFHPPLIIENALPYELDILIFEKATGWTSQAIVLPGEKHEVYDTSMEHKIGMHLRVNDLHSRTPLVIHLPRPRYLQDRQASSSFVNDLPGLRLKKEVVVQGVQSGGRNSYQRLHLRVQNNRNAHSCTRHVTIYCPYWLMNETGLELAFRDSNQSPVMCPPATPATPAHPILYNTSANSTAIALAGSVYSKVIPLDSVGIKGAVALVTNVNNDEANGTDAAGPSIGNYNKKHNKVPPRRYEFGVQINLGPAMFHRTKIITITARFILRNQCSFALDYMQDSPGPNNTAASLSVGGTVPFHWTDATRLPQLELMVKPVGEDWAWSGSFRIDEAGDFGVRLWSRRGHGHKILAVNVSLHGASSVVTILDSVSTPLYRIENRLSGIRIRFVQRDLPEKRRGDVRKSRRHDGIADDDWTDELPPRSTADYAWDEPTSRKVLRVELVDQDVVREYTLDDIKPRASIPLKHTNSLAAAKQLDSRFSRVVANIRSTMPEDLRRRVHVSVFADGPTRVLCFSDTNSDCNRETEEDDYNILNRKLERLDSDLRTVDALLAATDANNNSMRNQTEQQGGRNLQRTKTFNALFRYDIAHTKRMLPAELAAPALSGTQDPKPSNVTSSNANALMPSPLKKVVHVRGRSWGRRRPPSPIPARRAFAFSDSSQLHGAKKFEAIVRKVSTSMGFREANNSGHSVPARLDLSKGVHSSRSSLPGVAEQNGADDYAFPVVEHARSSSLNMNLNPTAEMEVTRRTNSASLRSLNTFGSFASDIDIEEEEVNNNEAALQNCNREGSALSQTMSGTETDDDVDPQLMPVIKQALQPHLAGIADMRVEGGELVVHVASARGLAMRSEACNPYLVLECEGQRKATGVAKKTNAPVWEEEVLFKSVQTTSDLRAMVYSRDLIGADTFLGEVYIPLGESDGMEQDRRSYTLSRRHGKERVSGELCLSLSWNVTPLEIMTLKVKAKERELDSKQDFLALMQEKAGRGIGPGGSQRNTNLSSNPDHTPVLGRRQLAELKARKESIGKLLVRVVAARNLALTTDRERLHSRRTCDPYARVSCGTSAKHVFRTKVVHGNTCPEWNSPFTFESVSLASELTVQVFDRKTIGADVFLGEIRMPLLQYQDRRPRYMWLPLQKRTPKDTVNGEIRLRVQWKNDDTIASESMQELSVEISVQGIGVSIVDATPRDLMHVLFEHISVDYRRMAREEKVSFTVSTIQIDNQLFTAQSPVVLARTMLLDSDAHEQTNKPMLELSAVRLMHNPGIVHFRYLSILWQEADVHIEEDFLDKVLAFFKHFPTDDLWQQQQQPHERNNANSPSAVLEKFYSSRRSENALAAPAKTWQAGGEKWYFEMLMLHPIKLNVTMTLSGAGERKEGSVLYRYTTAAGFPLIDINHVPLRLNNMVLKNAFLNRDALFNRILRFYALQALQEAHKLLGTVEFLGTPVSLISSLGTGVADFFYEPAKGIVHSPEEFARGVATGTISLLKNSVFGVMTTVSQMTGGISKGLAVLSMDDEYVNRFTHRPISNQDTLLRGAQDLGMGFIEGITGLVTNPIAGAERQGVVGCLKGAATGVAGVLLKPASGALEFISKTAKGIGGGIRDLGEDVVRLPKTRVRSPRSFGNEMSMQGTMQQDLQRWQGVLGVLREGKYKDETVVDFVNNRTQRTVLFTNVRIMYLRPDRSVPIWTVQALNVQSVTGSERTLDVVILYSYHLPALLCGSNTRSVALPFRRNIKCSSKDIHHALLVKLHVHVAAAQGGQGVASRVMSESTRTAGQEETLTLDQLSILAPHSAMHSRVPSISSLPSQGRLTPVQSFKRAVESAKATSRFLHHRRSHSLGYEPGTGKTASTSSSTATALTPDRGTRAVPLPQGEPHVALVHPSTNVSPISSVRRLEIDTHTHAGNTQAARVLPFLKTVQLLCEEAERDRNTAHASAESIRAICHTALHDAAAADSSPIAAVYKSIDALAVGAPAVHGAEGRSGFLAIATLAKTLENKLHQGSARG